MSELGARHVTAPRVRPFGAADLAACVAISTAVDPAPLAGAAARVDRQGVTSTTLAAAMARDPDALRAVSDRHVTGTRAQPELDPVPPPPFAAFVAGEVEGPRTLRAAWFLAHDGHRFVGVSTLERVTGTTGPADGLAAGDTAVHPAYRGRGIALALKLRTIAYAREHGYRSITTDSNASNARMLGLNAALGFRPRPARLTFERRLA